MVAAAPGRMPASSPAGAAATASAKKPSAAPVGMVAAAPAGQVAVSAAGAAAPIRLAVPLPAGEGIAARDVALVIIGGVPQGAVLSAGIDNGDGSWLLSAPDLVGLELSMPAGCRQDLTLDVTAVAVTSREGELASAADRLRLSLDPVPPIPLGLDPAAGHGLQALMIRGLPHGARLSAGTFDPSIDAWVVLPRQLDGLCVIPAAAEAGGFSVTVMGLTRAAGGRAETRLVARLPIAPA
jgi:hypothetical protein